MSEGKNTGGPRVFIATSISSEMGKEREIERLRQIVGLIADIVEQHGGTTQCAFREDNWLEEKEPGRYVPRDFNWCKDCDGAIVIAEDSHGVRIEEGWLSAMKKPMLRLFEGTAGFHSGLEQHLGVVAPVSELVFHSLPELERGVRTFIETLAPLGGPREVFKSREFAIEWRKHVRKNGLAGSAVRIKLLNPLLKNFIGDLEGKKVLDVGCGEGFSTDLLLGKGAEAVVGMDINPYSIEFAATDTKEAKFLVANMKELPFPSSSFDLILCYNVLMDAADDEIRKGVKEWQRVLSRHGRIIVTILHPLYSLFGNGITDGGDEKIRRYGLNEDIRIDTLAGFEDFMGHRRPLRWYAKVFTESGFVIKTFEEVFISEFEGISGKHRKRIGLPIFAVFCLETRGSIKNEV